jgi:hypothetical protein
MWSGFATLRAAAAINGGGSDRRQAAPRFLGFFCARLSCRAATKSITLLRAGLGGGAWRFCPFALSSIISLRAGANPEAQTLRMIEERFCKALGYAEHQRISVIHHDMDNMHIHVAINKIHPRTFALHDPGCDYKALKICSSIFQNTFADVRLFQKKMR